MAKIYYSDALPKTLNSDETLWVYNGLDCCLTHQIHDTLEPMLEPGTEQTYKLERALQNCTTDMTMSGILISQSTKFELIHQFQAEANKAQKLLDTISLELWGKTLSATSPKQCQDFFYDFLKIPPILAKKGNVKRPTTDDNALQEISKVYLWARPFVALISHIRDKRKMLGSLKAAVSKDGRMRSKFSVAGTVTGRFSAAKDNFGNGLNLQNQNARARPMYIADSERKMAVIDLEQAESRMLAAFCYALFNKSAYLDACESADLHSVVCKMIWKDLPWTGDLVADKKAVAEQPFYRHFTYRDMAKRGGHGTNYWGEAAGMSKNLGITRELMQQFQDTYFEAFPEIREYHAWVINTLQSTSTLITPFGRKRVFFGDTSAKSTIREAIAHMPQSSIGDIMNLGMLKVWKKFSGKKEYCGGKKAPLVQLHAQIHDAIMISYPERLEDEILPQVLAEIPHPLIARDREVIIPCEAETGWNWGYYSDKNPDGLKGYKGNDKRSRIEDPSKAKDFLGATLL